MPGRNPQAPPLGAPELPGPERWLHGRFDARIVALGRVVTSAHRMPVLGTDGLDATGCDADQVEAELHRIGHRLRAGYARMRLPELASGGSLEPRRAALEVAAAAPIAEMVTSAIAELDAAAVILRVADPTRLDLALAAPLEAWSRRGVGRPDAPPLRTVARRVIRASSTALLAGAATAGEVGAAADTALVALWQAASDLIADVHTPRRVELDPLAAAGAAPAMLVAVGEALLALEGLREETARRREALRRIGAELDRHAGSAAAGAEVTLVVVARAREALALGDALLAQLDRIAGAGPGLAHATARWRAVLGGVASRMGRCLDAIDRLVGMEH